MKAANTYATMAKILHYSLDDSNRIRRLWSTIPRIRVIEFSTQSHCKNGFETVAEMRPFQADADVRTVVTCVDLCRLSREALGNIRKS